MIVPTETEDNDDVQYKEWLIV